MKMVYTSVFGQPTKFEMLKLLREYGAGLEGQGWLGTVNQSTRRKPPTASPKIGIA